METMTDWQEPLVEGEKYAGILSKGAGSIAKHLVSKTYADAMELAAKVRKAYPDNPELVARATQGMAHAHPNPKVDSVFGLVPHGEVEVPRIKKLPEGGLPAGEVYPSSGLREHIPSSLDTMVMPDPGRKTGSAATSWSTGKPVIKVHPNQLMSPSEAKKILGHELTHVTSEMTDEGTQLYRGGSPMHIQALASHSSLPEQWLMAMKIRAGEKGIPQSAIQEIPKRLLTISDRELMALSPTVQSLELLRDKGFAGQYYRNLLGEGMARYYERAPNAPLSEVPLWLREEWDAPRRMFSTTGNRLIGATSTDPRRSSMSSPGDLEAFIHTLNR